MSCFARFRVVGIFELYRTVRSATHVDNQTTLTIGKISGVLNATSYNTLSPSVRWVYPDITSSGTPSSSSRVNVTRPCQGQVVGSIDAGEQAQATHIFLVEILLRDHARFNTLYLGKEKKKTTYRELETCFRKLILQPLQLLLILLFLKRQPRPLPIEQHLVDKPLLLSAQRVPGARLAQVGCGGHLGLVQILAHRFLVRVLARAFLGIGGGVAEGFVRRDILVEVERLEGDVKLGLRVGECELSRDKRKERKKET